MLAVGKVKEIHRLLAEGKLSQRKIAKAVGVGRSTVSGVASGRRPAYETMRRGQVHEFEPLGPIERCPSCGGRVFMPCRLCRVRKIKAEQDARRRALRLSRPPADDRLVAVGRSGSRAKTRRRAGRAA